MAQTRSEIRAQLLADQDYLDWCKRKGYDTDDEWSMMTYLQGNDQ